MCKDRVFIENIFQISYAVERMLKVIALTMFGLLTGISGIYIGYLFLKSLNQNGNFLFLAGSLLLVGVSVFILLRAGKYGDSIVIRGSAFDIKDQALNTDQAQMTLEKNNQLSKDWGKTLDQRNKLRMLQISANAEESK